MSKGVENSVLDLQDTARCLTAANGADIIFQLAADMGGMSFIESNKAFCMLSVLTTTDILMVAWDKGVRRFLYSSSACIDNTAKHPEKVAGGGLERGYNLNASNGVGGRNHDNTSIRKLLHGEPSILLKKFLSRTYNRIPNEILAGAFR